MCGAVNGPDRAGQVLQALEPGENAGGGWTRAPAKFAGGLERKKRRFVDDASRFFPEGHKNQNQKVPGGGRAPATSRGFDRGEPQLADLPEPSRN